MIMPENRHSERSLPTLSFQAQPIPLSFRAKRSGVEESDRIALLTDPLAQFTLEQSEGLTMTVCSKMLSTRQSEKLKCPQELMAVFLP